MNLTELAKPTYTAGCCDSCGAFVGHTDRHSEFHREIVEWLRALRDGKVDAAI